MLSPFVLFFISTPTLSLFLSVSASVSVSVSQYTRLIMYVNYVYTYIYNFWWILDTFCMCENIYDAIYKCI